MVSFRALRQIPLVIRFWIAGGICFKRKKLCFVARLCRMFKVKIVMSQPPFFYAAAFSLIKIVLLYLKSGIALNQN